MTNTLPLEAMIEILSWLPDKPLFRFKCVSKTWYKLLTDDLHFAKLHLQRTNPCKTTIMLLQEQTTCHIEDPMLPSCYQTIPLDLPFTSQPIMSIYGPLHGLLCFIHNPSKFSFYHRYYGSYYEVIIWSPLTRDHIMIPSHQPSVEYITGNPVFGFGHDQLNDQFKVVRMDPCDEELCISVYTLGTNAWRILKANKYRVSPDSSSVYVNGALHWVAGTTESFWLDMILAFDLQEDALKEIPSPQGIAFQDCPWVSISEYVGMLCLLIQDRQRCIQMWVMRQYGNAHSWTKQLQLQPGVGISRIRRLKPFGVPNNGQLVLKAESPLEFIVCDTTTNKTLTIKSYAKFYNACAYAGYLLSPEFINGGRYIRAWKNTEHCFK